MNEPPLALDVQYELHAWSCTIPQHPEAVFQPARIPFPLGLLTVLCLAAAILWWIPGTFFGVVGGAFVFISAASFILPQMVERDYDLPRPDVKIECDTRFLRVDGRRLPLAEVDIDHRADSYVISAAGWSRKLFPDVDPQALSWFTKQVRSAVAKADSGGQQDIPEALQKMRQRETS